MKSVNHLENKLRIEPDMDSLKNCQCIISPPFGFEPDVAYWVWAFEDTRKRTKLCLIGATNETLDWIPADGSNSIGTLLHFVAIELSYLIYMRISWESSVPLSWNL